MLQHLARVGSHEKHSAVAEMGTGDLHGDGHAPDHYDLAASLKLAGFPGIEVQRHVGRGCFVRTQTSSVAPDRIT
ncbi:hypothetical protein GGQ68_004123 [Sagittula marina]|uniref:Uncharacterized protein n=1 Tax=Sagittula marina TaxID=943940 RepID=A0A7W6GU37_9RHOB|nr:hypothetical protein [Sagittula marina]